MGSAALLQLHSLEWSEQHARWLASVALSMAVFVALPLAALWRCAQRPVRVLLGAAAVLAVGALGALAYVRHVKGRMQAVNTAACKRRFSLGCVPHTDGR